jgi:hypothetical protein
LLTGKKAGSDKKLYKSLEQQFQDEIARSPDLSALSVSPFGPLTEKSSRLTLIELISTLNAAFPDYDFSYVFSCFFFKCSMFFDSSDRTCLNRSSSVISKPNNFEKSRLFTLL